MRVKGLSLTALAYAVQSVNEKHGSQITLQGVESKGRYIQFTLRLPARWAGHRQTGTDIFRRISHRGRYIPSVCFHGHWHVYREIFARNADAVIVTALARYEGLHDLERRAPTIGERNIGSMFSPLQLNSACECPSFRKE